MVDETDQERSERLARGWDGVFGSLDNINSGLRSRVRAMQKLNKDEANQDRTNKKQAGDFAKNLHNLNSHISDFTTDAKGLLQNLQNLSRSKNIISLSVFTILASRAYDLSKTWKDMTQVGQTFNGSMLEMAGQAGAAGMSLDEFSGVYKKHNLLIKATNNQFFSMQKQLRLNTMAQGNYGMSVNEISEFMAQQMDVQRLSGSLQSRTSKQVVDDMQKLALTTSALARSSDKTVEAINGLATEAMSLPSALAQTKLLPQDMQRSVSNSLAEVTAGFASMPGQAGDFFSKFAAESYGVQNAAMTEQGKQLIDAGLGSLVDDMTNLSQKIRGGTATLADQIAYQNKMVDTFNGALPNLNNLQITNQNTKAMMGMIGPIKRTTQAEIDRAKATFGGTGSMTAFFSALDSIFGLLKGTFIEHFATSFSKVAGSVNKFADSDNFSKIDKALGILGDTWGTKFGEWISTFSPEQIRRNLSDLADGFVTMIHLVARVSEILGGVVTVFLKVASGVEAIAEKLGVSGVQIGEFLGVLIVLKKAWGLIKSFMPTSLMNVRSNVVNVYGAGGGGGGGDGGGGGGRKPRGRGFRGRVASAAATLGVGARGLLRSGSRGRALKLLGGRALQGLKLGGPLALGMESLGYLFGDRAVTGRNVAKSGVSLLGGALGALGGGIVTGGMGGEFVGGAAGYQGGSMLADKIFGADDIKGQPSKPSSPGSSSMLKSIGVAAALSALGPTGMLLGGLMGGGDDDADDVASGTKPAKPNSPAQKMHEEASKQTGIMETTYEMMAAKFDQMTRLLSKIEVSTQGMR